MNWIAYHRENCKDYDFCGALQGSGAGEDINRLYDAIDASLDKIVDARNATTDSHDSPQELVESGELDTVRKFYNGRCKYNMFLLARQSISSISTSIQHAVSWPCSYHPRSRCTSHYCWGLWTMATKSYRNAVSRNSRPEV